MNRLRVRTWVYLIMIVAFARGAWAMPSIPPHDFADIISPLEGSVVNISTVTEVKNKAPMDMPNFPQGSPFEELFRRFLEEGPRGFQGGPKRTTSLGSGFVIDKEVKDGKRYLLVVTCNHVIGEADKITVTFNDKSEFPAQVVGRDPRTDLALLRLQTDKEVSPVEWGSSESCRVGQWVIAIGNPYGLDSSVTVGIISTVARGLPPLSKGADYIAGYIQTDASINVGNSGGPMFNVDRKVIAISTAILSPNGGSIGIGFGIPSEIAKRVVEQLKQYGHTKRGWIGVKIQVVTKEIAQSLGLKKPIGALVGDISPQSPSVKAGIKSGDVILSFNGHEIKESRNLPQIVGESPIGSTLPMIVWRNGKEVRLNIVVGEFEEAEKEGLISLDGNNDDKKQEKRQGTSILGIVLQPIKPSQFERFGVTEQTRGLLVAQVDPESEAGEKGLLRPGDIIKEVLLESAREQFKDPEGFVKFIDQARKNNKKQILLLVSRGKDVYYVALSLEEEVKEKAESSSKGKVR